MKPRVRNFLYSLVACLCLVTGGAIDAQTTMFTSGTPPNGAVGTPYNFTFSASGPGCSGEFTSLFDFSATGLPNGLTLTSNGNLTASLTGTPTTTGTFSTVKVTAVDTSCETNVQQTYTITISSSGQPPASVPPATVYVANESDLTLAQVSGGIAGPFGSQPAGAGSLYNYDIARDTTRGNFVVAAGGQLTIYPSLGGAPSATITATQLMALPGGLFSSLPLLVSVAVDASGNIIAVDNQNNQVVKITLNASLTATGVTQIASYNAYAGAANSGDAYVRLDSTANYILALDNNNEDTDEALTVFRIAAGSAAVTCPSAGCVSISIASTGEFNMPISVGGLTLDGSGNYDITDFDNENIYSISPSGGGATLIFNGGDFLGDPAGIYYDSASGAFFFVDDENDALYTLGPSGCPANCMV
jgi:hypothetical protein